MAQASVIVDIPASADDVWRLIGGFGSLPDWLPRITTNRLAEGGRVRWLGYVGGESFIERLLAFDNDARSYSYTIVDSPIPVIDCFVTLRVDATGDGTSSRVQWSSRFTAKGVTDAEASEMLQRVFAAGLEALVSRRIGILQSPSQNAQTVKMAAAQPGFTTTDSGAPAPSDGQPLTGGPDGPTLLHDNYLRHCRGP
jgi:hypothetical protein